MNKARKKSSYTRKAKTVRASNLTRMLTDKAMRAKGFAQAEVIVKWPQIVGHELAGCSLPVKLIFPRGERMNGMLVIRCESAFAPLMQHQAGLILEMVNTYFGYHAVAKITLQQGPMPRMVQRQHKPDRALTEEENQRLSTLVGDGELSPLQTAIQRLGKQVLIKSSK